MARRARRSLRIVHDLAPGASIGFANAATDLDMMAAVNFLAANSDIVVDDLGFFFPDDQQSAVSRNTAAALNNPRLAHPGLFHLCGQLGAAALCGHVPAGAQRADRTGAGF